MNHLKALQEMLQTALQHHNAGRIQEAEAMYRQVLAVDPANFDALHLLGLLAHQTGRGEVALEMIGKAVQKYNGSAAAFCNLGEVCRAANRLDEAECHYRHAITLQPGMKEAYQNLGNVLQQLDRLEEAEAAYRQALVSKPDWDIALNGLGNILYELGKFDEAEKVCRVALNCNQNLDALHYLMGNILFKLNRESEAIVEYQQTLLRKPDHVKAMTNLGIAFQMLGRVDKAVDLLEQAQELMPNDSGITNNLGRAYQALGRFEEAEDAYRQSILLAPGNASAYGNLGCALRDMGRFDEAEDMFRKGIEHKPDFVEAYSNYGDLLHELGRPEGAEAAYEKALEIKPDYVECRFKRALLPLPMVATIPGQYLEIQNNFSKALDDLEYAITEANAWAEFGRVIGKDRPYHLTCLAGDHTALLSRFGAMVCRARSAWKEKYSPLNSMAVTRQARERVRLVIVSGHVRTGSIWNIFLHGLLQHIDRNRFETILYNTSPIHDSNTSLARDLVDRFVQGPTDWCKQVMEDSPDVIYYPEIGMDGPAVELASLRLASVQAAGWGHPITTGMPTMDLFLSGELMEGTGSEAHYVEKLVRLPGTGACSIIEPLMSNDTLPEYLVLPEDRSVVRFVSCQELIKLDPAHDVLYPGIAKASGPSIFLFLRDQKYEWISSAVEKRIGSAFKDAGLDPAEYVRFIDWPMEDQLAGLLDEMDVYLDAPGFSDYAMTWQALQKGLPVVTLEGSFLRRRLAAGLLRRIGITETIAQDEDAFVAIAAGLALNPESRGTLSDRLRGAVPLADEDIRVVRAFEDVLLDALEEHEVAHAG